MNMHDLEAFLAVVETGSIVAASSRLNLTQPGVTRRVQNFEQALGAELLNRQMKPLKPTAAGRRAYEQGRQVLRSVEDLRASFVSEGTVRGEFRLGIMPYLSEAALMLPLDRLRARFPDLTLKLTSSWSPRLVDQVLRNELDAAGVCLIEGMAPPEDLHAEDLGLQPVLVVAAPSLGLPAAPTLRDLARFPWIMSENGCGFRTALRMRFEAAHLPFDIAVEAVSTELRMSLVARGVGIGMVTPTALAGSPWRDRICIVEAADFRPQVRSWLLHRPPAGHLARPIVVFRDALAEALLQAPLL